ncbi:hypothetical protein CLIB1423_06S05600 [[Candida] railenensis]|uniref:Uncharacterized protein n=1 Tax=[Candida] railenensis TaxID=45579 RepID=A0A9P0QPA0_9ASCO|nr:hypothetical protein CLIB1423_06S05600 [[Candida] railenensis]
MDQDFNEDDFEENYQGVEVESDESYHSDENETRKPSKRTKLKKSNAAKTKEKLSVGGSRKNGNDINVGDRRGDSGTVSELFKIPASIRNSTRDYSFKQRFTLNYGFNESFYQHCLKYKRSWEDKLFYVDEEQLRNDYNTDVNLVKKLAPGDFSHFPTASVQSIDKKTLLSKFNAVDLTFTTDFQAASSLTFGQSVDLPIENRNGAFLNVGGHITSMKWLPTDPTLGGKDVENQYLATSIIQSDNSKGINDAQLGLFSTSTNGKIAGGVQIWKYNVKSKEFSLYKFYLTSETFGIASDLSWVPYYRTDNVLGVLSATFSDGKLHLIKIDTNSTKDRVPDLGLLSKPSVSYSLPEEKITCYDFLGYDKIIVGTSNGSIGEFILPTIDSTFQTPSYIQSVTEAPITSISVAKRELSPSSNSYTILVNSAGAQCFAVEYPDFQHGRVESWATNSLIKPIYNQNLKLFVSDDSQDSLTYSFVRHPHEKSTFIMKVDGTITSFHQSEILNHPLNLNGNSLGEVHIINIARKILNGSKATNKVLQPLRLWKLSKEEGKPEIHVNGDLLTSAPDKVTKLSIAPPEITISALAWNENLDASSVYSAASVSGLLIVERLDK